MEYEYEVTYTESYAATYRVTAKSKEEAEEMVDYGIREGTLEPPDECYDSNYKVVEVR